MDPIEHALDDFGRTIINRDNLPVTLHELAQAPTKDLDALDIETIGNLVDSVLWPLEFGDRVAFETVQLNIIGCSKITKNRTVFKVDWKLIHFDKILNSAVPVAPFRFRLSTHLVEG